MSECFLEDAFAKTFSQESYKNTWSKVGASPLTRKCLSESKVDREMGDNEEEDPVATVYHKTQHKNGMCVHHLIYIGYNINLLSEKLKSKTECL